MVKRKALKPRTTSSLAKYELTVPQWREMLEAQDGVCMICRRGGKIRHLSVDHDHKLMREAGKMVVRGLLCSRCNSALGRWEWDDDVLLRAIQYMQKIIETRQLFLTAAQ